MKKGDNKFVQLDPASEGVPCVIEEVRFDCVVVKARRGQEMQLYEVSYSEVSDTRQAKKIHRQKREGPLRWTE